MHGNNDVIVSQRIQNSLGLNGRENCLAAGPKLIPPTARETWEGQSLAGEKG